MAAVIAIVLLAAALAAGLLWLARADRARCRARRPPRWLRCGPNPEQLLPRGTRDVETGGSRRSARRSTAGLGELDDKVDRRLETAQKTGTEIHERLGKVDGTAEQMLARAKDLARLEQALRPPKARGRLRRAAAREPRCATGCRAAAYAMQHTFASGEPRRRGRSRGAADLGRLEVPARQLLSGSSRPKATRSGSCTRRRSRATSATTSMRSPRSTSGPRRAPTTSRSCTSRSRRSTTSSRAARRARARQLRALEARLLRVADDLHRVPAGDRARPSRDADRGARAAR